MREEGMPCYLSALKDDFSDGKWSEPACTSTSVLSEVAVQHNCNGKTQIWLHLILLAT